MITTAQDRARLPIALGVLLAWAVVTILGGKMLAKTTGPLDQLVKNGIGLNFLAACILLMAAIILFRWRDIGLHPPRVWPALQIMWFPILYFAVPIAVVAELGLPPLQVIAYVLLNTILVGISEELMFRGVLFRGLRSRLSIWPAIWVTSLLFGSMHVLNALLTGMLGTAVIQSATALMSGLLFMAILLRTGSIWPAIIYHAAWDFATFMILTAPRPPGAVNAIPIVGWLTIVPLLIVLPNALYGLYLLRRIGREDDAEP